MIGVIDVGGGLRGIYGAGVFDYCMDHNISFDFCVGVSAGSGNLASYIAGQRGRNKKFYLQYAFRPQYMGVRNVTKGGYINLNYIYGTLSNSGGEYPLDYKAMLASGKQFRIVTTHAVTGKRVYFSIDDMKQDSYDPIKASSCVPVVNKPYVIEGEKYFDGGLSDPIPVNRAFREGCDKVVVFKGCKHWSVKEQPKKFYRTVDSVFY